MPIADGKLHNGQLYDKVTDLTQGYTQQDMDSRQSDALLDQARTEITPIDIRQARVKVFEVPAGIDTTFLSFVGTTNLALPNVLNSITVSYNSSFANGSSIKDAGVAVSAGTHGGIRISADASAQSAANIIPDIQYDIQQKWANNVPVSKYLFYLSGSVTLAAILTRLRSVVLLKTVTSVVAGVVTCASHGLSVSQSFQFVSLVGGAGGIAIDTTYFVKSVTTNTFTYAATLGGSTIVAHSATSGTLAPVVSGWPSFNPVSHTITLNGSQVSFQQSAEARLACDWSSDNLSYSFYPTAGGTAEGRSADVGVTVRSVQLPACIHAAISITNNTSSATALTVVSARLPQVTGQGDAPSFAAIVNSPTPMIGVANASVSPTSLAATTGETAIPTYNLYIKDIIAEQYAFGYSRVYVEIINFADLP